MSSRILIPFDNNPATTSIKTTSYTVPSGKYALVKTESPFIQVNSVNIYPTGLINAVGTGNSGGTVINYSYISFSGAAYIFSATMTKSGANANTTGSGGWGYGIAGAGYETVSSTSRTSVGTSALTVAQLTGNALYCYGQGTFFTAGNAAGTGTTTVNFYYSSGSFEVFWVPSGTVLNGNNYLVTEYNVIS